jgi:hypothetical protein
MATKKALPIIFCSFDPGTEIRDPEWIKIRFSIISDPQHYKKMSLSSQKYRFEFRDPEKTFSGSRIQGSKRHRIRNSAKILIIDQ